MSHRPFFAALVRRLAPWAFSLLLPLGPAWALDPSPAATPVQVPRSLASLLQAVPGQPCRQAGPLLWRCDGPVALNDLQDQHIDGQGARIEFTRGAQGAAGIRLARARNLSLTRLEISWAQHLENGQPLNSLGRVLACPGGQRGGLLQLDDRYSGTSPLGVVSAWDDRQGWTWARGGPDFPDVYFGDRPQLRFDEGLSGCLPQLAGQVGRRVLARLIDGTNQSFNCADCHGVTIERVRLSSGPGMGFVFDNNASDIVLRDNVIAPACSPDCRPAMPSIGADGIHIAGAQGPVLIEGNDFGWQGDDAVNVTGLLVAGRIEEDDGATLVRIDPKWRGRLFLFRAHAPVTFYDRGLNRLGQARVRSVDREALVLRLAGNPALQGEVLLTAEDRIPTDVTIRGNHFHDHRARGILIGAHHALVENNLIERVTMQGLLMEAETDLWLEGPGASDVLIRNNRFKDVNRYPAGPLAPAAISATVRPPASYRGPVGQPLQDIRLEGNRFESVTTNAEQPVSLGLGVAQQAVEPQPTRRRDRR